MICAQRSESITGRWNWFDTFLACTGVTDVIAQLVSWFNGECKAETPWWIKVTLLLLSCSKAYNVFLSKFDKVISEINFWNGFGSWPRYPSEVQTYLVHPCYDFAGWFAWQGQLGCQIVMDQKSNFWCLSDHILFCFSSVFPGVDVEQLSLPVRIVKVFRLRFMKDLRLMVKGWTLDHSVECTNFVEVLGTVFFWGRYCILCLFAKLKDWRTRLCSWSPKPEHHIFNDCLIRSFNSGLQEFAHLPLPSLYFLLFFMSFLALLLWR